MNAGVARDRQILRIILIEGAANLLVVCAKTVIGLSTGSIAILGDALHSLTDASNNLVAWFVVRFSHLPADREHPYGHRKFETLAVFILASILVALSFQLLLNAINKQPASITSSTLELVVMIGVLIVNISVSTWEAYWAKRLKSDILMADASHTFADIMVTLSVIIGWQLSAQGYVWADRLCALGVSGFVMYLAYTLFRRAIPVLTDRYAVEASRVAARIKQIDGVLDAYNIRSRWMGDSSAIDLVIAVDAQLSTEQAHRIADRAEAVLHNEFDIGDVSIHVEPYAVDGRNSDRNVSR